MKKLKWFILGILIIILFTSCADTVSIEILTTKEPYGFWSGLWHGLIVPISFFGSLLDSDIAMYAVNNNGGWYDFGFWLGVGGTGAGVGRTYE